MDILGEVVEPMLRRKYTESMFRRLKYIEEDKHHRNKTTATTEEMKKWQRSIVNWEKKQYEKFHNDPMMYKEAVVKKIEQFNARIDEITRSRRAAQEQRQQQRARATSYNNDLYDPMQYNQQSSYTDPYAPLPLPASNLHGGRGAPQDDPYAPLPLPADFGGSIQQPPAPRQAAVRIPPNYGTSWRGNEMGADTRLYWQKFELIREKYFQPFTKVYPKLADAIAKKARSGNSHADKLKVLAQQLRKCIEAMNAKEMNPAGLEWLERLNKGCGSVMSSLTQLSSGSSRSSSGTVPSQQQSDYERQRMQQQQQQKIAAEQLKREKELAAEKLRKEKAAQKRAQTLARKAALKEQQEKARKLAEQKRQEESNRLEALEKERERTIAAEKAEALKTKKRQREEEAEVKQEQNKVVVIDVDSDTGSSGQPAPSSTQMDYGDISKKGLNYESSSGTPGSQMATSPLTGKSPLMPSTPGTVCDENETSAMFRSNEYSLGSALDSVLPGFGSSDLAVHNEARSSMINAALSFNATVGAWSGDPMLYDMSPNRSAFLEDEWSLFR